MRNLIFFTIVLLISCSENNDSKNNSSKNQKEVCNEIKLIIGEDSLGLLIIDTNHANEQINRVNDAIKACPKISKTDLIRLNSIKEKYIFKKDSIFKNSDKNFSDEQIQEFGKNMNIKFDDMTNKYIITHPSSPKYIDYNAAYFRIVYVKGSAPILAFDFQYHGDDWLFIENLQLKIDDEIYACYPSEVNTDVGGGVSEWFTEVATDYIWRNKLTLNSTVKIRINGKEFYKDIILTKKQIEALIAINDIFNKMQSAK